MIALEEVGRKLDTLPDGTSETMTALELLGAAEVILEHWLIAHDIKPTNDTIEASRLLALHRQGARADPTFNACRETCREIAYHFNVLTLMSKGATLDCTAQMMRLVVNHLFLFISGKLQVPELGDFCCASKPLRLNSADNQKE